MYNNKTLTIYIQIIYTIKSIYRTCSKMMKLLTKTFCELQELFSILTMFWCEQSQKMLQILDHFPSNLSNPATQICYLSKAETWELKPIIIFTIFDLKNALCTKLFQDSNPSFDPLKSTGSTLYESILMKLHYWTVLESNVIHKAKRN